MGTQTCNNPQFPFFSVHKSLENKISLTFLTESCAPDRQIEKKSGIFDQKPTHTPSKPEIGSQWNKNPKRGKTCLLFALLTPSFSTSKIICHRSCLSLSLSPLSLSLPPSLPPYTHIFLREFPLFFFAQSWKKLKFYNEHVEWAKGSRQSLLNRRTYIFYLGIKRAMTPKPTAAEPFSGGSVI